MAGLLVPAAPAGAQPETAWTEEISEAAGRFGIPREWIARVIDTESGGHTTFQGRPITSRAGAMGLMQLMPVTWSNMRAALGLGFDPHDPRDNILAGTAYLRQMYDRFGYPGLFAAYNAGPARYGEFLSRGRSLPPETVRYVAKIASAPQPRRSAPSPGARPILFVRIGAPGLSGDIPTSEETTGIFFRLQPSSPGSR